MSTADRKQDTLFVNSLAKGLRLLEAFDEEHHSLGLSELAKRTGLDKSATQRFANTLHQTGYLMKDEATRRFRPSHKFAEMAYAYLWSDPVVQLAMPKLIELSGRLGETINMAELSGSDIVYVARIPCQRTTFAATLVGRRVPALNTSGGRAILATLPETERRACIENWPLTRFTPETTQDRDRISELVEEAAHLGYSFSRNELILKEIGVAAPIIGADGRPVAAVHCSVSAYHWTREKVEQDIVPFLLDTANSITPSVR
ncbi:helix-turn-helix domain-containing protein [Stappia taiwanensis]|uniref:Helix-turn-helix domain-containing protein n=1 Tax=Stappia taiwanensis TaxID=992267 RepID=A0A838XK73_9HYPH|nr:helix-turn-helix domain-containing protein [Stappia taiwanensis]GGE97258.1 IclR family transcriptional regulator [Stappia taiwanensis]